MLNRLCRLYWQKKYFALREKGGGRAVRQVRPPGSAPGFTKSVVLKIYFIDLYLTDCVVMLQRFYASAPRSLDGGIMFFLFVRACVPKHCYR